MPSNANQLSAFEGVEVLSSEAPWGAGTVPSLIKWTGSKRAQVRSIAAAIPSNIRTYFEPFLGSGSVLYHAAHPGAVAGDVYEPLIGYWLLVRDRPDEVIRNYSEQWHNLQASLPDYFYVVRDRFNRERNPLDLAFLMRTCVNGIVRFNDDGLFNNSFHLSRRGMHPQRLRDNVIAWSRRIRGIEFFCLDYEETLQSAGAGDFVYLDPPYAGNKQRYIADLDQPRFFRVLEQLTGRGVRWAWSFDGSRGGTDLSAGVPNDLYRRRLLLKNGHSAIGRVLNGPLEDVVESLYLNYD